MLFVLSILQVLEENGSGAGLLVITMQSELELFCKIEGNWEGADCIDGSVSLDHNEPAQCKCTVLVEQVAAPR